MEGADIQRYRQGMAELTPREAEVLRGLLRYESSKVIAAKLGIKKTTVDKHRARILERTGVRSTVELIVLVNVLGPPDDLPTPEPD